ncbi:xanthine dehydrogenase family protein molybdopterin-binding subunit [Chondromyces crocatus]|uniref:Aldehyde dehydrogenase n=1 Tax=Chondromyces crocatus TaxID=52 RepID=A0A0K1ERQ6_CHOCO|nr:molybdopterin cofactor-binding domain-containing protein [Chondromyces crocatus]AKT43595.1 aldehyde dehydrogenase [Chondromyces crocatus]
MTLRPTRRALLRGALVLGFSLTGIDTRAQKPAPSSPRRTLGDLARNPRLDAWLRIAADGSVTLQVGKVELGQGALTALGQICADELDIDLARLAILSGDTRACPDQGTTTGSQSMSEGGTTVRHVAAEARALLLARAAERLGAPAARLRVEDGTITDPRSGKSVTYGRLVQEHALDREATQGASFKPIAARRYIGRPVHRRDLPAKITGEPIFLHDLRPDTLAHGRIVRAPSHGATLLGADEALVASLPGVLKVHRDGDFLGVIAAKEWQAIKAAAALARSARWRETAVLPIDPYAWLLAQPADETVIQHLERNAGPTPSRTLEATYRRPYQMHASIGPSCAVAAWDGDVMTVHTHSQSVFATAEAIAKVLGLPRAKVWGRHMQGAGCYGHNGADDAAADAALLARALPGRAIRVQWSREDEHTHEPYGSAMLARVRATLDPQGNVLDWTYDLWSTPHNTRPGGHPGNLLPARTLATPFPQPTPRTSRPPNFSADRNAIPLYAFPGQKITTHFVKAMPLRASAHRSLGAYANVFALESFMDELAHAADLDPLDFRLRHLKNERARAVLDKAAAAFGWKTFTRTPGRGRGIAFAQYKNVGSHCAVCLDVQLDPTTHTLRVLRAVTAVDAGEIVNPDGLTNQIEGGLIQSLSWTLKEAVRHDTQRILSRDWNSYPILTFSEVPPITVALLDRPGEPFLGAGEAAQGPTAAALANALFDATGLRARDLPLTPERLRALAASREKPAP